MENNGIAVGIFIVNILVVLVSFGTLLFVINKCFRTNSETRNYKFYIFKFGPSSVLFVFNLCAIYVNYQMFFVLHYEMAGDLMWLRYVDRVCVLLLSLFTALECIRLYPSAYDKITL